MSSGFITIEVHDEQFRKFLTEVQYKVRTMIDTLLKISELVEMQSERFVPEDTGRLIGSFKAVPLKEAYSGLQEVVVSYTAEDPRDDYDYADYTHRGIDYRTGSPINFHKASARDHYLWWGVFFAERNGAFEMIEGDYLSLFGLGGRK